VTTTAGARRARPGATITRRRNSRLDWLLLRWQARLDARWADRVVPWAAAAILFVVLFSVALARVDRLDAGADLAKGVQAAWHLSEFGSPETTIGLDGNYFALGLPLAFVPLGVLTLVVPTTGALLAAQAAAIALGVVPIWHLARKVVNLRVGAAAALVVVYGLHPAVIDLDLGDFHPTAMALTPLLVAAYSAERRKWARFFVFALLSVAWSSELGLVVATMGVVMLVEGERRIGTATTVLGLAWTVVALIFVQGPLGGGLVGPSDAFSAYGDTFLEVLIEILRNPFRPLGDVLAEGNVVVVVWVLAPLLFLPVLALRKLAPALPLTALYLVADVAVRGDDGGGRIVPLLAFSFVAAPFALARLGRQSLERVLVDRRLLTLLGVAAVASLLTTSALSPYGDSWRRSRDREDDLRAALAAVPPDVPVRVPEALAAELAERRRVELLAPGEANIGVLTARVDVVVLDESTLHQLDDYERFLLRRRIEDRGFVLVERSGDVDVFVRRRGS
jgi:uncharacterized membrane protein